MGVCGEEGGAESSEHRDGLFMDVASFNGNLPLHILRVPFSTISYLASSLSHS